LLASALLAASTDRDNAVVVPSLKGLVFVASQNEIQKAGLSTAGVSLAALPMLNQPAFQREVSGYLGHPLTFKQLNEITRQVAAFYKGANHPLVNVVAPEQDVSTGVIQILVQEYRVGEVRVEGTAGSPIKSSPHPFTWRTVTPSTPKDSLTNSILPMQIPSAASISSISRTRSPDIPTWC
jgi:hypothetical protein